MNAPDVERRILELRARELARPPRRDRSRTDSDVVIFSLARASYAIELNCLRHVFALRELALLPGAEAPLIGVTAWRGDLIPVLDLAGILGLPEGGPTDRGHVLVLGVGDRSFALLADAILDVITISDSLAPAAGHRFLRGVTADAVAVLDGRQLIRTFSGEDL
ncbi:MAG: chemotaxis protein CheW [Longimicrobiales bacterium]